MQHYLVYGITNILIKVTGFILIPVYTRYLLPEDYGVLSILMIVFSCASIIYNLGLGAGLTRSFFDYQEQKDQSLVIGTNLFGATALGTGLLLISFYFSRDICLILFESPDNLYLLNLVFITAFLESFKTIALTVFRTKKLSRAYSGFTMFFFLVQLGVILYLVIGRGWGIKGVIWGGLLSSGLSLFLLIPLRRDLRAGFSFPEFVKMLRYSAPLVPDSLAALILSSADRIYLAHYCSMREVGIYSLGAKLSLLISLILIEPFRRIWDVMVFSIVQKGEAKQYYTKLMTYFLLAATTLFLMLNCPIKEIIMIISGQEFWAAWSIVPVLSLAYVFLGINIICTVGLLIVRKTAYIPIVTILAALINLVLNYYMVPRYGMMGAAVATLCSFIAWTIIRYFLARRFYPIAYEWGRLGKITVVGIAIFSSCLFCPEGNLWTSLFIKLSLGATLPLWLIFLKFYTPSERKWVRGYLDQLLLKRR